MQNEPNFQKSQMFITAISTTNYNGKLTMDTWLKQTQTKPIYNELGKIYVIEDLPSGKQYRFAVRNCIKSV